MHGHSTSNWWNHFFSDKKEYYLIPRDYHKDYIQGTPNQQITEYLIMHAHLIKPIESRMNPENWQIVSLSLD